MEGLPKTLVVNADDFGLSSGINRGIELAYREGILRSASLMPNGAAFADAVRIVRENPGLGVGIHVSLVGEQCIAPAEKLRGFAAEDGSLPCSYVRFIKEFLLQKFSISEVRTEIEAQVTKVLVTGITPTHIDSHQHLHMLPGIFEVVLAAAQANGIKTIRIPLDRNTRSASAARRLQIRILSLFCSHNAKMLAKSGCRSANHFHGLGDSGNMKEARLLTALDCLKPGVNEIMMHPGFGDSETAARYDWGYLWDDECAALIAPRVRERVDECGVRLANFADAWMY
jgi:hopanoid biosynthesis associated protein HpnK